MFSDQDFLGCPSGMDELRVQSDLLNTKVVEQVNSTQELVMLNNFAHETNEYQIRQSLQERISDIESWRWVLEDLTNRLEEAIGAINYEHKAIRVVIQRIRDEIDLHSKEASRPGTLKPMSDNVEEAIIEEYNFLKEQKTKFERIVPDLEKQSAALEKTKTRIENDILNKQRAITVDESLTKIDSNSMVIPKDGNKKKKRGLALTRWEKRCENLKTAGLRSLSNAIITRQQVRGSRVQLSVLVQSYSARVDASLRRRLHVNNIKLEELRWQKNEAIRDFNSLVEELTATEQNLLETMEKERLIVARLNDRALRPTGELTKDDVDTKLKYELARLRHFIKQLRSHIERIINLQNNLTKTISHIDCCTEDLIHVVSLDKSRIRSRSGEDVKGSSCVLSPTASPVTSACPRSRTNSNVPLTVIKEEDEDDDYPFKF